MLVPVKHLIDGGGIAQVPRAVVTYYHLELPRHDVVLANGLTAESYLAGADPGVFARAGRPVALHPDLSSRVWEAEGCAPLVVTDPAVAAARRRAWLRRLPTHPLRMPMEPAKAFSQTMRGGET